MPSVKGIWLIRLLENSLKVKKTLSVERMHNEGNWGIPWRGKKLKERERDKDGKRGDLSCLLIKFRLCKIRDKDKERDREHQKDQISVTAATNDKTQRYTTIKNKKYIILI